MVTNLCYPAMQPEICMEKMVMEMVFISFSKGNRISGDFEPRYYKN